MTKQEIKRKIKKKTNNKLNGNQRTVKRPGEDQVGSLRAQKMLKELSNADLEADFIMAAWVFRGS